MRKNTSAIKLAAVLIALLLFAPCPTTQANPTLKVDPDPINFSPPSFMVGTESSEVLRQIANTGPDPLIFKSRLIGANPRDFTLGGCSRRSVVREATPCMIQIGFRPTGMGTRTAILELKTNDPNAAQFQIQLNGTATAAAPRVAAETSPLVFNTQPIGVASNAQRITIYNSGTLLLTITSLTIDNASEFSVITDCMVMPIAVKHTSVCAADVTFTPSRGGQRQALLTVISDDPGGPFTVPITGTGATPAVSVAPTALTFGSVEVGRSTTNDIVLTNTGSAPLTVNAASISGANTTDFTLKSPLPCTASNTGDWCRIILEFFAKGFGNRSGQVSFSTNVMGDQPSVALSGFGEITTPAPTPPKEDDLHFNGSPDPGNDRGGITCHHNGQRQSWTASVSRVIGGLTPTSAVARGTLSPLATLEIMALDSSATSLHAISINGTPVSTMLPTTPGSWKLRTVTFPAALLKFPAQASIGSTPKPEPNTIDIDPDTMNVGGCINIEWVRLSFKAMSPVILIHGNNSDGGFFVRQGFAGALTAAGIANDSSINLNGVPGGAETIARNAFRLQCLVPHIVRSFGVNSIHIVAHSKGGLDARLWLSQFGLSNATGSAPFFSSCGQLGNAKHAFSVISLTTLSTPHLGSALADLSLAAEASGIALFGLSVYDMRDLGLSDAGTPNLTTFFTSVFNPTLPQTTDYRMLGGDTNLNGDGVISSFPVDEYAPARSESSQLRDTFATPITGPAKANMLATVLYRFLASVSSVSVRSVSSASLIVTITHPVPAPTVAPAPNDLLVTLGSANSGPAPFIPAVPLSSFTLASGRDHASIANAGVAAVVIPQLTVTDRTRGDLK